MRASLLYNPFEIVERLAVASKRRRRRLKLKGTPAERLSLGHIDSLELLELLRPQPPTIIHDIGANVGTWTCLAKSLYPAAEIEAFEPLENHVSGFRTTTEGLNGVRLHEIALGPTEGTAVMEVTDFSDASSILPLTKEGRDTFKISQARRTEVRLATLDGLVADGTVKSPDLLKLDVQGFELEALRGAERAMASARAIIVEVSFRTFYEGQVLFPDLLAFLNQRGFQLEAFGASLVTCEPLSQADALFIRPKAR